MHQIGLAFETSFLARSGVSLAAIRFCADAIATSTASFRSSRTASISARAIFSSASFMRRSKCSFSDWRVSAVRGLRLRGGERSDVVHLRLDIAQLAPVVGEHLFRL